MIVQHAIRSAATASCLIAALIFSSCEDRKAQRIVDAAIEAHGGNNYRSFHLEFDFRDRHYTAARDGGIYAYTREFRDSTGDIRDVLNNEGFTRYRNGSAVSLPAEREAAFTRSVNSVIYFALLPFGLNDKAVDCVSGKRLIPGKCAASVSRIISTTNLPMKPLRWKVCKSALLPIALNCYQRSGLEMYR